uniref:Transthyretin-like protein 5 n=1 Tax=Ditylenchus dipsaci TaxID=166011 RepID=A0A915D749_9BILA
MNSFLLATLCCIALSVECLPSLGTTQSTAVRGVLECNGKPASGVKVKLYDVDRTDMDDLMDEGVSDSEGRFELKGHETEFTTIDPKVNIYHDCNDENVPCLKKVAIVIPDTYVTEGEVPRKTFDAGKLNLAGTFSGESRDCFN